MSLHYLVKFLCAKNCRAQKVIEANCHVHSHLAVCMVNGMVNVDLYSAVYHESL